MAHREDERNPSRRIAALLGAEIKEGRVTGRLRPYRELASEHGVATGTVQAAVRLLEAQGLVEIRGTAGVFIRELPAGISQEESLRIELAAVRKRLENAQQVLADTEAAVSGLLRRLPKESRAE